MADKLISADALKMMRFVAPKHKEPEVEAYMTGWNDAVDAITENALTIEAEPVSGAMTEDYYRGYKEGYEDGYQKAREVFEPKHGRWIECPWQNSEDVANGNKMYYCSCCKAGDLHAISAKVPYCWKCGAKMDKEDKGDAD